MTPSRNPRLRLALVGLALGAVVLVVPASAQRRGAAARPKLTEETLVPTELFAEKDAKAFGYPGGFDVLYSRSAEGHFFKLTEKAPTLAPGPSPSPAAMAPEASPVPSPGPSPDAAPGATLAPTTDEEDFRLHAGYIRPTFVTLVFAESAQAAAAMVDSLVNAKGDEGARPANLAVISMDKDPKLAANAVVYNREFNLGDKSGGMRRASAVVLSKGNVFLKVDAALGLKDGAYEAQYDTLEKRARQIATYLMRLM